MLGYGRQWRRIKTPITCGRKIAKYTFLIVLIPFAKWQLIKYSIWHIFLELENRGNKAWTDIKQNFFRQIFLLRVFQNLRKHMTCRRPGLWLYGRLGTARKHVYINVHQLKVHVSCWRARELKRKISSQKYSWLQVTRTLSNSNLPLTRSEWFSSSGNFLYNFTLDNSNSLTFLYFPWRFELSGVNCKILPK